MAQSSIPVKYLDDDGADGEEKWVIGLRNRAVQLRLTADRIVGEMRMVKNGRQGEEEGAGIFSIWKLDSEAALDMNRSVS